MTITKGRRRCKGKNKNGRTCKNKLKKHSFCNVHKPKKHLCPECGCDMGWEHPGQFCSRSCMWGYTG